MSATKDTVVLLFIVSPMIKLIFIEITKWPLFIVLFLLLFFTVRVYCGRLAIRCQCLLAHSDWNLLTQSAFICSKLTIEIVEQGVKYVQS